MIIPATDLMFDDEEETLEEAQAALDGFGPKIPPPDPIPAKCTICEASFSSRTQRRKHVKEAHNRG